METYCVKCRGKTPSVDVETIITKNGRGAIKGRCSVCSAKKSAFIKRTAMPTIDESQSE